MHKLSNTEIVSVIQQTRTLIAGLHDLDDEFCDIFEVTCRDVPCALIESTMGKATRYLFQRDRSDGKRRYQTLKEGMIDFAQPLLRAAEEGHVPSIEAKNIMMGMLESEVARKGLDVQLLLALRFPFREQIIVTLEALRIVNDQLSSDCMTHHHFTSEDFSPRSVSSWLYDFEPNTREHLFACQKSAIETLFLYAYRGNADHARKQALRWSRYRKPEERRSYDSVQNSGYYYDGPHLEVDGGLIFRFH